MRDAVVMHGFGEEAAHSPLPFLLGPHRVEAVLSEIVAGEGVFTFECEQRVEFGEEGFFMFAEAEVKRFLRHVTSRLCGQSHRAAHGGTNTYSAHSSRIRRSPSAYHATL